MNQELEIEFKNLLTKDEFLVLTRAFSINNEQFQTQINYYFDTTQFTLKAKKSALRIRFKKNTYTLTLKQTIAAGVLETHQSLTEKETDFMLKSGIIPNGDIMDLLIDNGLDLKTFQHLGTLKTKRAKIAYENGILFFDHSEYLNHEDYELEYEVESRKSGQVSFVNLLQHHHIPIRKTETKIQRLFNLSKEV